MKIDPLEHKKRSRVSRRGGSPLTVDIPDRVWRMPSPVVVKLDDNHWL